MGLRTFVQLGLFALGGAIASSGVAQTTAGAGTVVVLPLVASIPNAYISTVFVRNPNAFPITLNVKYYLSDDATPAPPGGVANTPYCPNANNQLVIAANASITFDPVVQCGFPASDIFGMIVLEDAANIKTNTFVAYSRTESPSAVLGRQIGNGFSVEGFPIGTFSNAPADALGLRNTAAAPHYKSNCFVGALNETVNYQIRLWQGETGIPIGGQLTGTVLPWHTKRILDVFAAAGAAGDHSNVRATFTNATPGNNAAMITFCTVETSDNGSADFRVAKSLDARDNRQSRLVCYGMDSCTALTGSESATDPAVLPSGVSRNIHYLIIDAPDFVKCDLVSQSGLNNLQMVLRGPTDIATGTTAFANPTSPYNASPYTSGGPGLTSFYIYTGDKGQTIAGSGASTRWYIDVSRVSGTAAISYGIRCQSGNGVTIPWLGAQL